MKWNAKKIIVVATLSVGTYVLLLFFPIIITVSEQRKDYSIEYGENFGLLDDCDFSVGDWRTLLVIDREDNQDTLKLLNHVLYESLDIELLKNMQQALQYTCSPADMATVQSTLYLYCNDKLEYSTGIVLDKNLQGFQCPQCGWVSGVSLLEFFKRFEPVYKPIVFL